MPTDNDLCPRCHKHGSGALCATCLGRILDVADDPLTCIHRQQAGQRGLCEPCQEDHDADPCAWMEFGLHAQGIANWEALQRQMAADAEEARRQREAMERERRELGIIEVADEIPW